MKIKVDIGGDIWTIQMLTNRTYTKKHGNDSAGITETTLKYIDINKSEYSEEILIHELAHAFLSYQSMDNLNLGKDAWEEVYCEFIGKHLRKIMTVLDEVESQWNKS